MITVSDLTVEVGGRLIVDGLTFSISAGAKVGLVGRNGAGKTSLLKVLAGAASPAKGRVSVKGGLGYLGQDTMNDPAAAHQGPVSRVLSGRGLGELSARIEKSRARLESDHRESNITKYVRLVEEFERLDGYRAESEAKAILAGLGLKESRFGLALGDLSGGERRRVELARILFAGSEVLLLDEPTNHLDLDAKSWLLGYLKSYPGVLVVVSHDLELLDESINRIFHLERGQGDGALVEFKGNYSAYRRAIAERRRQQAETTKRAQEELGRLTRLADSMRHQTASRARVAKTLDSRASRIRETLVDSPEPTRTQQVTAKIPEPLPCDRIVLEVDGLCKAYGKNTVFEDLDFVIERGERFLVAGLNGAGKTTLLQVLAGRSELDLGMVTVSERAKIGYFAQEHEELDFNATCLEQVIAQGPTLTEAMATLAAFGLVGEVVHQPAGTLSGGEKTKLALAVLVAGRRNVLLLDEPTNNLDPESRAAISTALAGWRGTMICVTHDAEFARMLDPGRVLLLPEGTIDYFSDDYLGLIELA
ncbi:MAG: ABC-F family ATP-binding cassette domain-containing protein [Actinomycetota bacterium]|nr:ABC-F family ATP-binding cassette domain-containing protein [Actinomycetota bacterium]